MIQPRSLGHPRLNDFQILIYLTLILVTGRSYPVVSKRALSNITLHCPQRRYVLY